jgi:hypothetical protein
MLSFTVGIFASDISRRKLKADWPWMPASYASSSWGIGMQHVEMYWKISYSAGINFVSLIKYLFLTKIKKERV